MTERETLLQQISESAGAVVKLNDKIGEINAAEKKYKDYKTVSKIWFTLILWFLCVFLGAGLMSVSPILFWILFFAPWVLMIVCRNKAKGEAQKIEQLLAEYKQIQCDPTLEWLPMDYREPYAWSKIKEYLENQRTNTLSGAINMLEDDKHKERMENILASSVRR